MAIDLYIEGNDFRRIFRLLKKILNVDVCFQLVVHWIRTAAQKIDMIKHEPEAKKIKFHCWSWMSYLLISKKANQIRVWTAVDKNRLRFAGFEVGDASSKTFRKFWNKIINHYRLKIPAFMSIIECEVFIEFCIIF